jgi:L-arabinokinase
VPAVFFYISGHGFGHSVRQIEIVNALLAGGGPPDLRIVIRTGAPAWLFARTVRGAIDLRPAETDTGVVQIDALRLDERQTVARARAFLDGTQAFVDREAELLAREDARLVVSDAPALACTAARRAGVPSVVCSNFTWDWIYRAYEPAGDGGREVVARTAEAYAAAVAGWRLPMHGGFETIAPVIDLPFVARRARRDRSRDELRDALALPRERALALVSFGGYGVERLPLGSLDCTPAWGVVVTGTRSGLAHLPAGICGVTEDDIYAHGLRYEDLVRAVDVVITKPGYGIISDCIANGAAMLYTPRGNFPEYDVLVREMPAWLRCEPLTMEALLAGRWRRSLDEVSAKPPARRQARTDGAAVAAQLIRERISR